MEGIDDGRAVDDCWHCVFVDPDVHPCPHCANRMRYLSASLGSGDDRDEAVAAWRGGDRNETLLRRLWQLGLTPERLSHLQPSEIK